MSKMIALVKTLSIIQILLYIHTIPFIGSMQAQNNPLLLLPKGTSIHRLDNGLQVLLIENPALPMVGVNVVVKIGSAYETFATSGMSHMLEHLLFNGTETRTQKQLYNEVDLIGGYNNAHTSYYYTNYMMVTPSENIKQGMIIQADMLFNSVLPADKFEKEKGIVLEEIATSLNKPSEQVERSIRSILYQSHALSLPTLGTYATIESLLRDDVYRYYKNAYVPNNMIMSVIGNFQANSMLTFVKETYGQAQPGIVEYEEHTHWKTGLEKLHDNTNTQQVYHRSYNGEKIQLQLFYKLPQHLSYIHFDLLQEYLDKSVDHLKKNLESDFSGVVTSTEIGFYPSPVVNYMQVTVSLEYLSSVNGISAAVNDFISELKFNLTPETVAFLATAARTGFLKNIEKPHMFGIYNAKTFAATGIESVLQAYAPDYYYKASEELRQLIIDPAALIIIHYPGKGKQAVIGSVMGPGKLFEDKKSGLTLIAKQNPNSELLAVHFMFKHKAQLESEYGKNLAQILHDCFGQRVNSTENQKISNQYGLTFTVNDNPYIPMDDIYLHPDFSYIRVEGLADDLSGVINYLRNQLEGFTPSEEEFIKAQEKTRRPSRMMAANRSADLFKTTYTNLLYEKPKYAEGSKDISYEALLQFAKRFFRHDNMIISVVSPASADSITALFLKNTRTTDLKPRQERVAYQRPLKLFQSEQSQELQGGGEQSYLFWGFTTTIVEIDKPALKALALILSDRIIFDIREKQGRAYRMSAGLDMLRDKALFFIRLGTRPANIDPLLPQMPAYFNQKILDDISEEDLRKSVNMYLGRMMFRRLSSINQAYYLAHSFYFENDINYDQHFLNQLKNISLNEVKDVARKYMQVKNPVTVIMR
jgi:predicted Zn-dependent peptidase